MKTIGRIIPACAGSTSRRYFFLIFLRDHPRMCGEHTEGAWRRVYKQGSSPHVRGAHHAHAQHRSCRGIIPACAGSTRTGSCR